MPVPLDVPSKAVTGDRTQKSPRTDVPPVVPIEPGTAFVGLQRSGDRSYNVKITVNTVEGARLSGSFSISNLAPSCPTLTTFWEAEVISSVQAFRTGKWGATEEIDLIHWRRLGPCFEANGFEAAFLGSEGEPPDFHQSPVIFMRLKEEFLIPDHRASCISGVSFQGFYYISFERRSRALSGVYFFPTSAAFQSFSLTPDDSLLRTGLPSYSFR
ncbi:vacuolar import and degradation protein-domain-containing protein [Hyaloraphidium curvatum]|nr:vacuolar import and degradation protein-domain-containing protein [Hyaloraphidium curvatum]